MPYIKQSDRTKFEAYSYTGGDVNNPDTVGELNYCITSQVRNYLQKNGLSYQTINNIVGALEGAKLEFYRRIAVPYEDQKIKENGDVY